ncbi:uncharacterized protein G2W53_027249 [Senna tora]|uniref:Uncharacterized protein n=1 Tax=Senna tora TaxID=362788 RepID=A0A834WM26_9FABA|nr:uncharacterized protein G2W53_027249 [Senna tora]
MEESTFGINMSKHVARKECATTVSKQNLRPQEALDKPFMTINTTGVGTPNPLIPKIGDDVGDDVTVACTAIYVSWTEILGSVYNPQVASRLSEVVIRLCRVNPCVCSPRDRCRVHKVP